MTKLHDDEIEVYALLQTLWGGKHLIVAWVVIALAIGCGLHFLRDIKFESRLFMSIANAPPHVAHPVIIDDFQRKFTSFEVFQSWKKSNGGSILAFDDISFVQIVDGIKVSKETARRFTKFDFDKKLGYSLVVASGQLNIIDEVYEYAQHVNSLMTVEYISQIRNDIEVIDARSRDINVGEDLISIILGSKRFVDSAVSGSNLIFIDRPSVPKKTSVHVVLILGVATALGGVVGVFVVLFQNVSKRHKKQMH